MRILTRSSWDDRAFRRSGFSRPCRSQPPPRPVHEARGKTRHTAQKLVSLWNHSVIHDFYAWMAGWGWQRSHAVYPPGAQVNAVKRRDVDLYAGFGLHAGLEEWLGRQKRMTPAKTTTGEMQRRNPGLAKCDNKRRQRLCGSHGAANLRSVSGHWSFVDRNTCRGAPPAKIVVHAAARRDIMNVLLWRP